MLTFLANAQSKFIDVLRIAVFIVMAWIGGLKAFPYEAEGIVPFVANSPFMSFFYHKAAPEYNDYKHPEGKVVAAHIAWNKENGTYTFAYILGAAIIGIGLLTLSGVFFSKPGLWGGLLTFGMALVTLSFLVTTPEAYVPDPGGDIAHAQYGFPYLSGAGRLVLKDVIMMAAGLVCAADSARKILQARATRPK